jgi:glycosyltransferase involved in cell wall biosynthesis
MRVGVYSIALNEAKFAARWAKSVADADFAFVADTGSTDDTVAVLHEHRIPVERICIKPFRFDDARNAALALMPHDLDVMITLDLDEILVPDWRSKVERAWSGTRMRYRYQWNSEVSFLADRIVGRHTHRWTHPVHETLSATGPEVWSICHDVLINHHADAGKPRSQYLGLLQLSVIEDPHDDRSAHYYGRELFFYQHYEAAITELTRHLALPRAQWAAERACSMRYIAKCHEALGDLKAAHHWFLRATMEDDSSREPLIDAARFQLGQNAFHATIDLCERALAMSSTNDTYLGERYANDEGPYDLASVAYYHLGQRQKAVSLAAEAVRRNPSDPRLQNNLAMMGG